MIFTISVSVVIQSIRYECTHDKFKQIFWHYKWSKQSVLHWGFTSPYTLMDVLPHA